MDATLAGEMIDIRMEDGLCDAYVARPKGEGPFPAVLFYMDGPGLRPVLHQMADRIAARGYTVLQPNLFYRNGRAPLIGDLATMLQPENLPRLRERIQQLLASLTVDRFAGDAGAYLDVLAARPEVRPGGIGIVGYCLGGGLAVRTAAGFAGRVAVAASFHGGNLASEKPDSPHLVAGKVRAELYFAHADEDPSMPEEQIERLEAALDAAGVLYRWEIYSGARHGFTMRDLPAYDEAAANKHWDQLFALLQRGLGASAADA